MSEHGDQDGNGGLFEDLWLLISIGAAIACVAIGVALALAYRKPEWVNRAGAAVVAVQLLAAMIEFSRRRRLRAVAEHLGVGATAEEKELLEAEIARSESQAFAVVVSLAVAGELLHGFGDLLFESIFR